MSKKLETKHYYLNSSKVLTNIESYTNYIKSQTSKHHKKKHKHRNYKQYKTVADKLLPHIINDCEMICLGTRNNHERDCFKKALKSKKVKVYSCDIAKESKANFILDFNNFPDTWCEKWNVIYSNSIDHAISATDAFFKWYRLLKPNGIMVLAFVVTYKSKPDSADCCYFNEQNIDEFFEENKIKILDKFEVDVPTVKNNYLHYIIQKV